MSCRLTLTLLTTAITSCAVAPPTPLPRDLARIPDRAEVEREVMEAYGAGEAPKEAVDKSGVQVVFQTGHTSSLSAVSVSADGRHAISGGQDGMTRVWDVASGQEIRAIAMGGIGWPKTVGFTPDGSRFFAANESGSELYDRSTGDKVLTGNISLLARNGRARVSIEQNRASSTPVVVDSATGALIWKVPASGILQPFALSADGKALVTFESALRIWRQGERQPVLISREANALFASVALSGTGRWLAVETMKREIELFDATTGAKLLTLNTARPPTTGPTHTLTFSPDERQLAYATADGLANLWRVPDGSPLGTLEASSLSFSDDGKTLVLGGARGGAPWLREVDSGKETRLSAAASQVNDVAIADRDRSLIVAGSDGKARQWDLATAEVTRTFDCAGANGAWSVATHPTAPLLALGCMDGSATVRNRETGARVSQLPLPPPPSGTPAFALVAFSADGHTLVAGSRTHVIVWDVSSSRVKTRFDLPAAAMPASLTYAAAQSGSEIESSGVAEDARAIAVDASARVIAVGRAFDVTLFDASTGRLLRKMGNTPPELDPDSMLDATAPLDAKTLKKLQKAISKQGLPAGMLESGAVARVNSRDIVDSLTSDARGASHLAFSADGRRLYGDGTAWDVASGAEIRADQPQFYNARDINAALNQLREDTRRTGETGPVAVSPNGRLIARAAGRVIRLLDSTTGRELRELKGHRGNVQSVAFAANGRRLFSGGADGAVRVWSLDDGSEIVALTSLGAQDFVAVTPDQFYRVSKARLSGVAFRKDGEIFPFEQFDLRFNRPDIVMERLGIAAPAMVQGYRQSWQRRVKKLGFTEKTLQAEMNLPVLTLKTSTLPITSAATSLALDVHAEDRQAALDRFNVFVNDVPVFGTRGLPVDGGTHATDRRIDVPLAKGRNRIQVSVLNANGVESLRQTVYVTSEAQRPPPDVWVVAIGVSRYQRSQYSLRYAAKDASDVAAAYQALGARTHVLNIADADATRQGIENARRWLEQAKPDDLVVVFAAGHGMTDKQQNYFFGTYDIDPDDPGRAGLPFESFEALLDGIAPLRKLLLVDTCFSGEIEKDDAPAPAVNVASSAGGTVVMRSFSSTRSVNVVADTSVGAGLQIGAANAATASASAAAGLQLQRDLFADLRRGTGAVVISSASGSEFALEGEQWKNGVFTYALLRGIRQRAADSNADGELTVGELQAWVTKQVVELTHGGQNPTVRRENLSYDFPVF